MNVYIIKILHESVVNTKKIYADRVRLDSGSFLFFLEHELQFACPTALSVVKTDNIKRVKTVQDAKIANYLTVLN